MKEIERNNKKDRNANEKKKKLIVRNQRKECSLAKRRETFVIVIKF